MAYTGGFLIIILTYLTRVWLDNLVIPFSPGTLHLRNLIFHVDAFCGYAHALPLYTRTITHAHTEMISVLLCSYSDQEYDSYENAPKSSHFEHENSFKEKYIPRTPVQQTRQSLGNFDEWHVGRERGVVDDVIEQIREAWDVAKLSTKDIFFKKDSDVDIRYAVPDTASYTVF